MRPEGVTPGMQTLQRILQVDRSTSIVDSLTDLLLLDDTGIIASPLSAARVTGARGGCPALSALRMGGGNVPRVPYKAPGEQGYQVCFCFFADGCSQVPANSMPYADPDGGMRCAMRLMPGSDPHCVRQFLDIWTRLQRERILYIGQDLDDEFANQVLNIFALHVGLLRGCSLQHG